MRPANALLVSASGGAFAAESHDCLLEHLLWGGSGVFTAMQCLSRAGSDMFKFGEKHCHAEQCTAVHCSGGPKSRDCLPTIFPPFSVDSYSADEEDTWSQILGEKKANISTQLLIEVLNSAPS